ncbi:MAG: hypothetical protein WD294_04160 [Phycisphaeraceae bacterium]
MHHIIFRFNLCSLLAVLLAFTLTHADAHAATLTRELQQRSDALIISLIEDDADFLDAYDEATELLARTLAYAESRDLQAVRQAVFAQRMIRFTNRFQGDSRAMLKYLHENQALAYELMFLMRDSDDAHAVFALLDRLRQEHGNTLNNYPGLTAAVCVVHQQPLERRINENRATAEEPEKILAYYLEHERHLLVDIKEAPGPLMLFVVDTTASVAEMRWALSRFRNQREVGRLFFEIEYDYAHYRGGKPKAVTEAGFNLPNIYEFGGVCADQAYFAETVGKAIGVPAVYSSGRSGSSSHAWVGFLARDRSGAYWNFDFGRYAAYRGVRGHTRHPQTRQMVNDSVVGLTAELVGVRAADRQTAAALVHAAHRLGELNNSGDSELEPLVRPSPRRAEKPRGNAVSDQLELLEHGLRLSPGCAEAWQLVAEIAEAGDLGLAETRTWADKLMRLAGTQYPDFAIDILRPMISNVEDVDEQNKVWERAFAMFSSRQDVCAEIRMAQGRMWEEAGNIQRAGRCYEDVIARFANAGPFMIEAVKRAEALLRERGDDDKVVRLYDHAFALVEHPADSHTEFRRQGNWYRLAQMYAERLAEAEMTREHQKLLEMIEEVAG